MFFSPSVVISLTTVIFFTTAGCNESFFFDKYQDNKMRFCFVPSKHCSLARHCSTRTSLKENQDILSSTNNPNRSPEIGNVAIVGGGLAGLSTAFHLLQKSASLHRRTPRITIIDKNPPGNGGASSVAGGLLHPFSPSGKVVHMGIEGLQLSNALIDTAQKYSPECVTRDCLYRLALNEKHVTQLQKTANSYPEYATWLMSSDIEDQCGTPSSLGGILLKNGCKIIHVPSYLQGLWAACQHLSDAAEWSIEDNPALSWKDRLSEFDAVILSAGSGLIHDSILPQDRIHLPAMLVRGQSIKMNLKDDMSSVSLNEGVLCGNYITPSLHGTNKVIIGSTKEFQVEPLNPTDIYDELRKKTFDLSPTVWKHGEVDSITCGYKVQTKRTHYGRIPILGRAQLNNIHHNAWLFTGLSSRGLIHHGICGSILSSAILEDNEDILVQSNPSLLWWKSHTESST